MNDISNFWNPVFYIITNDRRKFCVIVAFQSVNAIIVSIEFIIARFMVYIQHDKDEGRDPNTQAEYVHERCYLITPKDPKCDSDKTLYHR